MKILENRILRDAQILPDDYLMVDSFLDHQVDMVLANELAGEFFKRFSGSGATKVISPEGPGNIVASLTALKLDVPLIIARKMRSGYNASDFFTGKVVSFTNSEVYDISVSRRFLSRSDNVLIISDFLAKGNEAQGTADIVGQAGSSVCGLGFIIEKTYLDGAKRFTEKGIRVESLAKIRSMSTVNGIRFVE